MAVAYVQDHTSGVSLSGTSIDVVLATDVPADRLLVVWIGMDNQTATAPTVTSVSRPAGETAAWARAAFHNSSTATAGAGVRGELWVIVTTQIWPEGTSITLTLSGSPPKSCATIREYSGVTDTVRGAPGSGTSTGGTPTASTSGTALVTGDLVIGAATFETNTTPTDDTDTSNGTWSAGLIGAATTGKSDTQVRTVQQHKIVTGAGVQTYNPTESSDSGAVVVGFEAAAVSGHATVTPAVVSAIATIGLVVVTTGAAPAAFIAGQSMTGGVDVLGFGASADVDILLFPATVAAHATVPIPALSGPPSGLTATPVVIGRIDLSWNEVLDATGYDVDRDGVVIAMDVAQTSYTDLDIEPATSYDYRVRAVF